jgi:hypothetical protein
MRTKSFLAAAALIAAGALSLQAQSNVYSLNVVGYVNVSVAGPSLFNMVANPFNTGTNGANQVLPDVDQSQVLKWNPAAGGFDTYTFDSGFGGWIDSSFNNVVPTVPPGEGFFYFNPNATATLTFVGEVAAKSGGSVTNVVTGPGFRLVGSKIPYGGAVSNASFNLPIQDNMQVLEWNGSTGYITSGYDSGFGGWIDDSFNNIAPPTIDAGQGFFYNNPSATVNWIQSLP